MVKSEKASLASTPSFRTTKEATAAAPMPTIPEKIMAAVIALFPLNDFVNKAVVFCFLGRKVKVAVRVFFHFGYGLFGVF